jgi:microcystin-dependent protein
MKNKTMRKSFSLGILLTFLLAFIPLQAIQAEPMIGEVKLFAGNFAPRGWALANGQLLNISENPALFSILGARYGGDGRTTFALPDLRGRTAVGAGKGPRLFNKSLGQLGGYDVQVNKAGEGNKTIIDSSVPFVVLHYIISLDGIYPRN